MPEHDRAIDGSGRRWHPTACDARVEQLVSGWLMVPPGDRVDRAESRRVEAQERAVALAHEHVVREFVLHDDIHEIGAMRATPHQQLFERA